MRIGDVILVRRKPTWWAAFRHPISSLISWRIRSSTGSPWNHVAGYIGSGFIVEAEWDRGVRRANLAETYPSDEFEIAVAQPPALVDRDQVRAFWVGIAARGLDAYDWRAIVMMRTATLPGGHEGVRRYVNADTSDNAWICSELGAAGRERGGFAGAERALLVPGDFDEYR